MSQNFHTRLVIFTKTPELSPVKTRLQVGLGKKRTLELFDLFLKCTQEVAIVSQLESFWSLAEEQALTHPRWKNSFSLIYQGEGSLNKRLFHSMQQLWSAPMGLIFIGADSPHLNPKLLKETAQYLDSDQQRAVVGPTEDGGFYLFGINRLLSLDFWESIPMGQTNTCQELFKALSYVKEVKELPLSFDIDRAEDLKKYLELAPEDFLPAQKELAEAIKKRL